MSVTGQGADPLSCTVLVKPIIRVGLFSVTMVHRAFACATHDGLLAGILTSNSKLPAFTPALRLREPPCAVRGMHFLVYLKGEELRLPSHLTSNIKLLRCCHPTPIPGLSSVSRKRIAQATLYSEDTAVYLPSGRLRISLSVRRSVVKVHLYPACILNL